jgi:hypothetical protein
VASLAVMTAVETRLAANWSRATIITPNTTAEAPGDGSPYLTVTYPVANEEQMSVGAPGSNLYREEGAFRLVLSVPIRTGLAQWHPWINELRALFRGVVFDGVVTWEAPPPATRNSDDDTRCEISFAVPYRYDIFA